MIDYGKDIKPLKRSNEDVTYRRQCVGKVQHTSESEAVKVALKMENKHNQRFYPYECLWCGKYHTGRLQKYE